MKKIVYFLFIVGIILIGVGYYKTIPRDVVIEHKYSKLLESVDNEKIVDVLEYTIYGKHFNLQCNIDNIQNYDILKIVLKSVDNELEYETFFENDVLKTNEYINKGILLENIPSGNYLVLLKVKNGEEISYHNLVNKSEYKDLEYYTLTKNNKNNKIVIDYDNYGEYSYMYLEVSETKLPDHVYDIVIDPGHGGSDPGAMNGKYNEGELNLEYGLMLKDALMDLGLKVKMTREENVSLKTYGHNSRTAIPYETKAKLMLSLHLNSTSSYTKEGGVEVYTASGDDLYFASKIADNIVNETSTVYSNNSYNKIKDGVYTRIYTESDVASMKKGAIEDGWEPYEVKESTTYYYFIRETGGIITKAFADGRNPKYEANPYYNANYGVEAYLLELGYISNSKNLKILLNEKERYIKAIKESVKYYLDNNY